VPAAAVTVGGNVGTVDTAIWGMLVVGAAVTYAWRALGVALSGRINPDGPVIVWVACVAYALLAGLVARMIVLPYGALASVDLWIRLGASAIGLGVFYATRRNILAGVLAGIGTLAALVSATAP